MPVFRLAEAIADCTDEAPEDPALAAVTAKGLKLIDPRLVNLVQGYISKDRASQA
ncbi:MAG: hypothetical protein M3Y22_11305 [Pseudomonadota bacterium]|jgi:hypothetical protein|nr:hypothetical protein [Pseudomonadota bacterium]